MRQLWRLFLCLVAVEVSMMMFGAVTGPLLLSFAADIAFGWLIIRSTMEMRAATDAPPAGKAAPLLFFPGATSASRHWGRKGRL